ncbi:translation initiation factor IF-2-like [Tachyglossus aculeatus]|uniref:translation initiation factor IF-2-like n=1 Tax=Tachyglossus aculeatus TaxID=9261 RepID=UPI0018F4BBF3|nr:translation initiation factor IF-2-like [Tachyglossus aculeatus]
MWSGSFRGRRPGRPREGKPRRAGPERLVPGRGKRAPVASLPPSPLPCRGLRRRWPRPLPQQQMTGPGQQEERGPRRREDREGGPTASGPHTHPGTRTHTQKGSTKTAKSPAPAARADENPAGQSSGGRDLGAEPLSARPAPGERADGDRARSERAPPRPTETPGMGRSIPVASGDYKVEPAPKRAVWSPDPRLSPSPTAQTLLGRGHGNVPTGPDSALSPGADSFHGAEPSRPPPAVGTSPLPLLPADQRQEARGRDDRCPPTQGPASGPQAIIYHTPPSQIGDTLWKPPTLPRPAGSPTLQTEMGLGPRAPGSFFKKLKIARTKNIHSLFVETKSYAKKNARQFLELENLCLPPRRHPTLTESPPRRLSFRPVPRAGAGGQAEKRGRSGFGAGEGSTNGFPSRARRNRGQRSGRGPATATLGRQPAGPPSRHRVSAARTAGPFHRDGPGSPELGGECGARLGPASRSGGGVGGAPRPSVALPRPAALLTTDLAGQ